MHCLGVWWQRYNFSKRGLSFLLPCTPGIEGSEFALVSVEQDRMVLLAAKLVAGGADALLDGIKVGFLFEFLAEFPATCFEEF